jgi:FkbM family methyltransferase
MNLYKKASSLKAYIRSFFDSVEAIDNGYYEQQESCQVPHLDFLFQFFLGRKESGVFVEIGAHDGVNCSNTWGIARRGWAGYLVEAIPEYAEKCRQNHKDHTNVIVEQIAIGAIEGEEVTFNIGGQLTTANTELNLEYKNISWAKSVITSSQVKVATKRLDTFLEERGIDPTFDLLVIDVEGFEAQVFSGFELSKWVPKMLIVELTDTHPDLRTNANSDAYLGQEILSNNYQIVYKDCINTVFVHNDVWKVAFSAS